MQRIGLRFIDLKHEIARMVEMQKANREALAAVKSSSSSSSRAGTSSSGGAPQGEGVAWVLHRGVYLRLPRDQAARVLRQQGQQLADWLEELFAAQKEVLAEMEAEGLEPHHFTAAHA